MKFCSILLVLPSSIVAFSSIPMPPSGQKMTAPQQTSSEPTSTVTSAPWRIALNIGREPLSAMPFDWARSGCRMPLVIPCEFNLNINGREVSPISETVSFTGENGAVVRPVQGGTWKLNNDQSTLSFTLHFPEKLNRRDVTIEAGSTLHLETKIFSKKELNRLNEEFYAARDETWKVGGELNDIARQREAPKKWNEEKGVWEKQDNNYILSGLHKRMLLFAAQAEQKRKNSQRPNPQTLSMDNGPFPTIVGDDTIYVQKDGIVKVQNGGGWRGDAVIGTWSAEPINNRPASYYR